MKTSDMRIMTVKALEETWKEVIMEKKVMIRAFEKTGISWKVDGSEDATKMHFQGQDVGVPDGLELN